MMQKLEKEIVVLYVRWKKYSRQDGSMDAIFASAFTLGS
jgi:hypothetical protein